MTLFLCLLAATFSPAQDDIVIEDIRVVSALEAEWGYVAIRPVYAEAIAWVADARDGASTQTLAQMRDAATSGTLPRALGAMLAARETATSLTLTLERREELTSAALAVLRDPSLGWGAGPLASGAVESSVGPGLSRRLLDQFGEDAIKHNATRGADLFRLGLLADRNEYQRVLAERWIATPAPRDDAPESQERVFLASLLLSLAVDRPADFADPEQTWLSLALSPPTLALPPRWATLAPTSRSAALDAARSFAGRRWSDEDLATNVAAHNRERAWVLLELVEPTPTDELLAILADAREGNYDRYHAACVLMVRSPGTLASARGCDALASLAVEDYWRTPHLAQLLAENTGRRATPCGMENAGNLVADALVTDARAQAFGVYSAGPVLDYIERDFIRRLELESRPRAQIGLWNFLLAAGSEDAAIAVANAAVTNFVADEETGNAGEAQWALMRVGTTALPAAEAGLRVAEELRDWQLAAKCSDILEENAPGYALPEQPHLLDYMLGQLADDGIEGNAAAAMRYLRRCGGWADGAIRDAAERGDWQQRMYARELLSACP